MYLWVEIEDLSIHKKMGVEVEDLSIHKKMGAAAAISSVVGEDTVQCHWKKGGLGR